MSIQIPGLPEGVLCARIGQCEDGEFELHGDHIEKGARGFSQIVVAPADGYEFVFDMATNHYACVKKLATGRKRVTVVFEFPNALAYQRAGGVLYSLNESIISRAEEDIQAEEAQPVDRT